jgi:putative transposase
MAVRNKIILSNETYFITFTILGWQKIFVEDKYCRLILKWFDYVKNNYSDKIYGYVIMPNHIHCLIYVADKSKPLPVLIFNAKRFLAYEIVKLLTSDNKTTLLDYFKDNKIKPAAKHKVFEDRYDSQIVQSRKYFLEKLNYIHNNPCAKKWKLAVKPEDYLYSSASNYILGKGFYDIDIMDF